jgi:hypothetical protein
VPRGSVEIVPVPDALMDWYKQDVYLLGILCSKRNVSTARNSRVAQPCPYREYPPR